MHTKELMAGVLGTAVALTVIVGAPPAGAAEHAGSKTPKAPLIKIKGGKSKVTLSTNKVAPGPVQFKVEKTYVGPQGPDTIDILATEKIDKVVELVPKLGGPEVPPATAAAAVTKLDKIATIYGGSAAKGVWQAELPEGKYYAISLGNAMQGNKVVKKFKVKGSPSGAVMHDYGATVSAVTPNTWKTKGMGTLGSGWIRFRNKSEELHFLQMDSVKPDTTKKMVREALASPEEPDFLTGTSYFMDVVSPGVDVVWRGPFEADKYVLTCFMPSESDGMPHALMGMWKLTTIG